MFEEFAGLPLHPLVVHTAVVFVPLLALASLVYALVPPLRARLGWVTVALAVVAPAAAGVAVLSGYGFQERRGLPLEGTLADHRDLGLTTLVIAGVLGVLALALVWWRSRPGGSQMHRWTAGVLSVLVVLAALAALFYVIRVGDVGSRMVWEQLWPAE